MIGLYPIKFRPILKERVWGGTNLKAFYNKDVAEGITIGESWELSGIQGDISIATNGYLEGNNLEELIEVYMGDLVGDRVYEEFGNEFPLLIKLIDAGQDLSIQVHPDNELAMKRHNAYGKTEMWYVLDSRDNAKIMCGFKSDIEKGIYTKALENNTIGDLLNNYNAVRGDAFFIPPGRVHAIGAGNVLAEIQQCSDITYRIYDWNRPGMDGKARELHTDLALDAIDYKSSKDRLILSDIPENLPFKIAGCKYFTVNMINLDGEIEKDYFSLDSFVVYLCISGSANIVWDQGEETIMTGETIMIPASLDRIVLNGKAEVLEIYIEEDEKKEQSDEI